MKKLIIILLTLIQIKGFSINPDTTYRKTPDSFSIKYIQNEINFKNTKLISWELIPDTLFNGKTIVFAGPDAGNMAGNLPLSISFLKKGYKIVLFDYRGFGKSSKFLYDKKSIFHEEYIEDLEKVISYYQKKSPENKLILYGQSMGTILISKIINNNRIKLAILESPPYILSKNSFDNMKTKSLWFIGMSDKHFLMEDFLKSINKQNLYIFHERGHLDSIEFFWVNEYGDIYCEIINNFIINNP